MPDVTFTLHVHQPLRVRKDFKEGDPFDCVINKEVLDKCAGKSYIPTCNILLETIDKLRTFKVGFSLSGSFLEQCEKYRPDVLDLFKQLAETGNAEVLTETYYHSLASLYESPDEFGDQVREHQQCIRDLLSRKALGKVFRNTELIYSDKIAGFVESLGFKGIFTEGAGHILEWRSPNFLYAPKQGNLKILTRNYRLSDDIGYRFSSKWWEEWPLTAEKFARWLGVSDGQVVNVYIDFETFGEHHWEDSQIFHFLKALPWFVDRESNARFCLPTEVVERHEPVARLPVQWAISWADLERDVSAWLRNKMQFESFERVKNLRDKVLGSGNPEVIRAWRHLQTSDHLYYMCDKWWQEGDIHKYFSYYDSPKAAYHNYNRALNALEKKLKTTEIEE